MEEQGKEWNAVGQTLNWDGVRKWDKPGIKGSRSDTGKPGGFCSGDADSAYAESGCVKVRQTVQPYSFSKALLHEHQQWKERRKERKKRCSFQLRFTVLHWTPFSRSEISFFPPLLFQDNHLYSSKKKNPISTFSTTLRFCFSICALYLHISLISSRYWLKKT